MFTSEFFKKNIIFIICIIIFVAVTIPSAVNNTPFFDAAWGWYLAKIIKFDNAFNILANEKHCIIWYLILKPFAAKNILYPYSLQLINWFFCFCAILVMWRKSAADNYIKILITFSFVVTQFFAVTARCYSIGLLGLVLLTILQKKSLKHPILYSTVLGLTANTSAMAAIPVSALTIIFFADIIKQRKEINIKPIIFSLIILFGLFSLMIAPLIGSTEWFKAPRTEGLGSVLNQICTVIVPSKKLFFIFSGAYVAVSAYVLFIAKGIKSKFLLIYSLTLLIFLMSAAYNGTITHKLFLTVYLFLAVLLQNEEQKYTKFKTVFGIFLFILLFIPQDVRTIQGKYINKDLGFYMLKPGNIFENSCIAIEEPDYKYELIPYILQNKKITLLDNSSNLMPDYKMRRFGKLEIYTDYAKKNNKTLYLITHFPYGNYEPVMIFEPEDKENQDRRYIYKFDYTLVN